MSKLFFVNPMAVRDKNNILSRLLSTSFSDYSVCETKQKGDSGNYVYESSASEVFAVGGDGTIRDVAEGFCHRVLEKKCDESSLFGVIPFGSGNDFAKSIYNNEVRPEKVISKIIGNEYKKKPCDIGIVNDKVFLNIASVGFDAEIVKNSERYKKSRILRRFSYVLALLYTVFRFDGIDIDMEIDGKKTSEKMLLLAVANGKYYGGGIKIAPDAIIDDGLFDIVYIPAINPLKLLFLLPTIVNGKHIKRKEVTVIRGRNVSIKSKQGNIRVNYDGELLESDTVDFKILPSLINIYRE